VRVQKGPESFLSNPRITDSLTAFLPLRIIELLGQVGVHARRVPDHLAPASI
jgi:hypothetical protein